MQFMINHPYYKEDDKDGYFVITEEGNIYHHNTDDDLFIKTMLEGVEDQLEQTNQDTNEQGPHDTTERSNQSSLNSEEIITKRTISDIPNTPKYEIRECPSFQISSLNRYKKSPHASERLESKLTDDDCTLSSKDEKRKIEKSLSNEFIISTCYSSDTEFSNKISKQESTLSSSSSSHKHQHVKNMNLFIAPEEISIVKSNVASFKNKKVENDLNSDVKPESKEISTNTTLNLDGYAYKWRFNKKNGDRKYYCEWFRRKESKCKCRVTEHVDGSIEVTGKHGILCSKNPIDKDYAGIIDFRPIMYDMANELALENMCWTPKKVYYELRNILDKKAKAWNGYTA